MHTWLSSLLGLGPYLGFMAQRFFPLKLRAQGLSVVGVAVNRVMSVTFLMYFFAMYQAITIGGTFFICAGISVLAWVFFSFYFFLPEVKGRSLEEMELLFSTNAIDD